MLLFISLEVGETNHLQSLDFFFGILCAGEKILCCTDVKWLLGNTHLELNVQQMLLQQFSSTLQRSLPPPPTFLFTSAHFFQPGPAI